MNSLPLRLHSRASRRDFIRRTGLLSVAAVAPQFISSARASEGGGGQVSTDPNEDIIAMSAVKLAGLIRAKKVSAREAVEAYINRQLAVNDMLNAVVMNCYARAREEAKKLDDMAARGEWAGPLHGVPMIIKDSLDTEGVITTGATYGRQQYIPKKDATVVARVRNRHDKPRNFKSAISIIQPTIQKCRRPFQNTIAHAAPRFNRISSQQL